MSKPRLRIPKTVKKDEIFPVKAMVHHPMHNGRRKDKITGRIIPRFIINKFICEYNGRRVFVADLYTSMSENPYFSFYLKGKESGAITFTWTDDNGESITASHTITVQ